MPNLVVYVPAAVWRLLEAQEGKVSAPIVARAIANRALLAYTTSGPGEADGSSSGASGASSSRGDVAGPEDA